MKAIKRPYEPQRDFLGVRDLLAETFSHHPLNWTIERWNYARYFCAPLFGSVQPWEDTIGIWEDQAGRIVGVVSAEGYQKGEVHIQTAPGFWSLYPQMIAYAEEHLAACTDSQSRVRIHIQEENPHLIAAAEELDYTRHLDCRCCITEHAMKNLPPQPNLPSGFVIRSMADCNDIERRRRCTGLSFNHTDPKEWPSAQVYQELQRAPDYRPDLDLYVVAPDGQFISCCIVWHDPRNQICMLEPVGTLAQYRRRGFAREVIFEGFRRAARLGATRAFVGTDLPVYLAIGFEVKYVSYWWEKVSAQANGSQEKGR